MDREDEQLLRGQVYGTGHDHPGPLPHRDYAHLVGGPLDGLLLDITDWTAQEIQSGDCKTFGVTPDHGRCIDDQQ